MALTPYMKHAVTGCGSDQCGRHPPEITPSDAASLLVHWQVPRTRASCSRASTTNAQTVSFARRYWALSLIVVAECRYNGTLVSQRRTTGHPATRIQPPLGMRLPQGLHPLTSVLEDTFRSTKFSHSRNCKLLETNNTYLHVIKCSSIHLDPQGRPQLAHCTRSCDGDAGATTIECKLFLFQDCIHAFRKDQYRVETGESSHPSRHPYNRHRKDLENIIVPIMINHADAQTLKHRDLCKTRNATAINVGSKPAILQAESALPKGGNLQDANEDPASLPLSLLQCAHI
ncbi:hypothetical protein BD413DRAFT_172431 [Trametes elegans]|nr:hypothetical protein BD413DRAFT_172431 [Trametes elegans]